MKRALIALFAVAVFACGPRGHWPPRPAEHPPTAAELAFYGMVIGATVIAVRFLWIFPASHLSRLVPSIRRRDPTPSWQELTITSWSGMRGIVSLVAALAVPMTTLDGAAFPYRDQFLWR